MIVVPAVLIVAGAAAFFALRGGRADSIFGGRNETIPKLELTTAKAVAVPTTATPSKKLKAPASAVAKDVTDAMDALYTAAFLDPGNWRDGSYEDVWAMFEEGARAAAEKEVQVLTLGAEAGDTYESVGEPMGKVEVKVLMSKNDRPATAVATVVFTATAAGEDGTQTQIVSKGQYFLERVSGAWTIYSYSVRRQDQGIVPTPGPSGGSPAVSP